MVQTQTSMMSMSFGDMHLSQGMGSTNLALGPQSALHPPKSIAELSSRRREAIKGAFRRIDTRGAGSVSVQDINVALQRFSNLTRPEQEQLMHGLSNGQAQVSFTTFAGYYQFLGSTVERDRDFEDLLRHHWGFAEVSDILDDMKNKFAMVGLAYAFRHILERGGSPDMSLEAFQQAVSNVGMHYNKVEIRRLFDAFDPTGSGSKSLEVHQLTQHLTSAPRPSTPIHHASTAHFSEVSTPNEIVGITGRVPGATYSPSPFSPLQSAITSPTNKGKFSPPVAAPPEEPEKTGEDPPVQAPDEEEDENGPKAPPEADRHGKTPVERPPEAPPEDDEGELAPPEQTPVQHDSEPPPAPHERALPSSMMTMSPQKMSMNSPQKMGGSPMSAHGGYPAVSSSVKLTKRGRQRAVTVGINYIGLQCQLSGCINDSDTFVHMLTTEFGYSVQDIRQLRDDHPQRMPSKKNLLAALSWLVSGASEGDHLFFHYSGHGTQQEDTDGDEMDGKDDCIVPCDFQHHGFISDDELRSLLVESLPKGVRLTCILDCCHSGTALDLPYKVTIKENKLVDIKKKAAHKTKKLSEADVVMISGCKDTQTSADCGAGMAGNTKSAGAMTTAFKNVITRHKDGTFHKVLDEIRKFLKSNKFAQVPQMSSEHFLKLDDCFMPEAEPAETAPEKPLRAPVRKALTVGINYLCLQPGHGQLSGCINDSDTMIGILKDTFGFNDHEIVRLRDDHAPAMPTKANILAALRWLTTGASAGDELFFHYSGHGGQVRDTSGDEASGKDDTLIPCDFQHAGQIIDDDLHAHIVEPLPKGVRMWVMLDCCHSGTALDLPHKVQLSPDGRSMQFTKAPQKQRLSGSLGGAPPSPAEIIMISGCKDTQTSADVQAGSMGSANAAGAMTTAFRHCVTPTVSCEELLGKMHAFLKRNQYVQVPQMSSEQYIQLDAGFVSYTAKARTKRAAGTRDLVIAPQAQTAVRQQAPPQPSMPPPAGHMGNLSPMAPPLSPLSPMHPQTPMNPELDMRLSKLEAHIADLRTQQGAPGFPVSPHPHGFGAPPAFGSSGIPGVGAQPGPQWGQPFRPAYG
jgi:Ca2+-binding EF-hand superfamily protein